MDVDVIGAPSVTYSADAPGTIIGADLTVCEGDARLTDVVQLAFTQAAIAGSPSYLASYTIDIDTTATTAFTETFSNAAAVATDAATLGLAQPVDHGDGAGFVCLTNAGGDKRTTVYTYTILGVNDRISRKSDYLTNSGALPTGWSLYDTTAETIAITVNPAPVTGPIYHIGNMWAN
ncbi:MAG: hypothetical protein C0597_17005 [Marinilabiliales bacterium]|nr:MAG: hypothetical protein C0597_17005 [Marinilabiliales bacterium]